MLRAPLTARVTAIVAIAAGALVASVIPSGADVSTQSPSVAAIRVESPATLLARGAAVAVTLSVVCTAGERAFVNVAITERVGNRIASGENGTEIPSCTGGFQTVRINVASQNLPFRRGTAFAQGALFVSATTARDDREITIVR